MAGEAIEVVTADADNVPDDRESIDAADGESSPISSALVKLLLAVVVREEGDRPALITLIFVVCFVADVFAAKEGGIIFIWQKTLINNTRKNLHFTMFFIATILSFASVD